MQKMKTWMVLLTGVANPDPASMQTTLIPDVDVTAPIDVPVGFQTAPLALENLRGAELAVLPTATVTCFARERRSRTEKRHGEGVDGRQSDPDAA